MNRQAWQQIVKDARNGNDTLFNSAVSSNFEEHFYEAIYKLVQDEVLTREIYNSTMFKFWERFILNHEDLPESNIDGYIFKMSRNAFYELNRQKQYKRNLKTVSLESQEMVKQYASNIKQAALGNDDVIPESQSQRLKLLHEIIQAMDSICQSIIRQNIMEETPLKQVKEDIAMYGTYNAIVQKKKRCINTLQKRFRNAMSSNKYTLQTKLHEDR